MSSKVTTAVHSQKNVSNNSQMLKDRNPENRMIFYDQHNLKEGGGKYQRALVGGNIGYSSL